MIYSSKYTLPRSTRVETATVNRVYQALGAKLKATRLPEYTIQDLILRILRNTPTDTVMEGGNIAKIYPLVGYTRVGYQCKYMVPYHEHILLFA